MFEKEENRKFVTVPPSYMEWLKHDDKLDFDKDETVVICVAYQQYVSES